LWKEDAWELQYNHKCIYANTSHQWKTLLFSIRLLKYWSKKICSPLKNWINTNKIVKKLVKLFKQSGLGLVYLDPEIDKYSFANESLEKKSGQV
jgi:hypothetical protein